MSGLMSITGEPDGRPLKVGVAVGDVLTGLFAAIAIMAALRRRDQTGYGQHIDLALFDAQLAALVNVASNYLNGGGVPGRMGNEHPNIVPYQTFPAADGDIVVAVGNDRQFARLCTLLGRPELAEDERFARNAERVRHRDELAAILAELFRHEPANVWMERLNAAEIPCGPILTLDRVFADPQVAAREMVRSMLLPTGGLARVVGNPMKLSETPVSYRNPPPALGEHTAEVLRECGFRDEQISDWWSRGVIRGVDDWPRQKATGGGRVPPRE
jgi:crotonobetainyl-CoA:carnitine CoA-transferase CaiB-like acyl-CoA transferase